MNEIGLRQRLAAHTALRLGAATILLGLAVALEARTPRADSLTPYIVLLGIAFGASFGLLGLLRFAERRPWTAYLHFTLDSLLISAAVYLTGGVDSLFTPLYALPILTASTVNLHGAGLRMAALNAALFVGVVVAQYGAALGLWHVWGAPELADLPEPKTALYVLALNVFGFIAVALLAGSLADRARRANVQLVAATESLADLQLFNQHLMDNLLSGVASADAQNRLITFNRSALSIIGWSSEPPIGRPATEVIGLDPARLAEVDDDVERARTRRFDYQFTRPDGKVIDIGLSIAPLPLPGGASGYLYTFQDVTEVKRMERDAVMQQRLAAVGEMAAGIAHEIRNPLASMSGSMQMLRQELTLSGDQGQLMDIVLKESDRLNQTIQSFLAYARPKRANPTRLDLRTLIQETAMLLRNSPGVLERNTVSVSAEEDVPFEADENQVRQILWNLATNGLRAMPKGGELRLGARREVGTDHADLAVLEVTDRGVGMTPEQMEGIFQPFRGSFGRGTGLGLAIVHRIVTDHGARIDVQSEPGVGTTFTVRFPASQGLPG